MKTEQIRLVLAIAHERSISKASEQLHISQPTASTMLKSLERELGYTLFTRTRAGALPTEAGTEFIEYAEAINRSLQAISKIRKPIKRIDLRILTGRSKVTEQAFERLCEKYITKDYAVGLSYQIVSNGQEALKMVHDGNGDVAVVVCLQDLYDSEVRNSAGRNLTVAPIGKLWVEVTCPKDHPIIKNGSIDVDLLDDYPCFSSVDSTRSMSSIPFTVAQHLAESPNRVIMDHSKLRYQLLRKTNGYLISIPIPDEIKEAHGLASLPVENTDMVMFAAYRKDPQKQALINEYIEACRDLS